MGLGFSRLMHSDLSYTFTTPLSEPQATNWLSGDTPTLLPTTHPSSVKRWRHCRDDISQTYTSPSAGGGVVSVSIRVLIEGLTAVGEEVV